MAITAEERLWSKVQKTEDPWDCWNWKAGVCTNGYAQLRVNGRLALAHRLAREFVSGPIPTGLCVLHACDNRRCCNPVHLFLGTRKDNSEDMFAKGRQAPARGSRNGRHTKPESTPRGEGHFRTTLTDAQVLRIRELVDAGAVQRDIAKQYSVTPNIVNRIIRRRTWAHI